jgi:hypothetical protein
MKTFQKIALVSAIAAAPFAAQAELKAMDDALMGDTTGQAGVTIDMSIGDAGITIGSVTYTDTKGTADSDGGSVVLENISIKNITNLSQTIDVSGKGNLVMGMSGSQALVNKTVSADGSLADLVLSTNAADFAKDTGTAAIGNDMSSVATGTDSNVVSGVTVANASSITAEEATAINAARLSAGTGVKGINIALGGTAATSAVMLRGDASNTGEAELVNNLSMNVDLGDSTTTIYNLANSANGTLGDAGVKALDGSASTEKAAIAISMASSFRLNDLDVGVFGYTEDQAATQTADLSTATDAGGAANAASLGKVNAILTAYNNADSDSSNDVALVVDGAALSTQQSGIVTGAIATGSAIQISNMSFVGLDGGMVSASQKIWATSKGVNIQMGSIAGNLNIGSIAIGGKSIGSVAIANLNLAGMTQTIYWF